jgi:hypothetical protein
MSDLTSAITKLLTSAELGSGLKAAVQEMMQKAGAAQAVAAVGGAVGSAGLVEKALFLTVLRSATQKAAEAQQFNLETQMNDLWNKLGQIRSSQVDTVKLQGAIQKQAEINSALNRIIKSHHDMSKSLIQSIR